MNSRRIFIGAVAVVIIAIIAIFVLYLQFRFVDYTAPVYTEHVENLSNPYTGWYEIKFFQLSDSVPLDLSYFETQEFGPSLVLLEVDLQNYREKPLSTRAADQLRALLSACRSNGKQAILRFMYDHVGKAIEHEPADISLILTHMTQSAQIINQFPDCVYILQGLFVGAWGELHTSRYTNAEDLSRLAQHLNRELDPSIFLAVRTPEQWRKLTGSETQAVSLPPAAGTLAARLSLFNDGMLGSETDLGTYAEPNQQGAADASGKRSRKEEIAFQHDLCQFVPNGGEVVIDNPLNDLNAAIPFLQQTHVSYLNSGYDANVLSKWSSATYAGSDLYAGMNGYEYIGRHLGYRYVVRSSELVFPYPWLNTLQIMVKIDNVGFAPAYRTFDVTLLLQDAETGTEYSVPVSADSRQWEAGIETMLEIPLEVKSFEPGTYNLLLQISDPVTDFDVAFANAVPEAVDGISLGSIRIRQFPNL